MTLPDHPFPETAAKRAADDECFGNPKTWDGNRLRCQTHGAWWPVGDKSCALVMARSLPQPIERTH